MIWNYCEKLEFILKRSKNYLQRFCLMVTHPWKNACKSLSLSLSTCISKQHRWDLLLNRCWKDIWHVALWDKTSKIYRPTKTCDKNKTAYYSNLRHALRYMYTLWQCLGPYFTSPSLYFISSPKLVVTIPKFIWTQ